MRRLGVLVVVLLSALSSRAAEWEFISDLTEALQVDALEADPAHARLLMGTLCGYRIYEPASGIWIVREPGGGMGTRRVFSFLANDGDSLALLTGRGESNWLGYIMDNAGLTPLGPILLAGWDASGEEEEWGFVRGLGRTPGPPEAILACVEQVGISGVIFRSLDGGQTWERVRYLPYASGTALRVAPNGDVLVGYGAVSASYGAHGVLRSSDAGETWQEISGDMPCAAHIGDLAIDPQDSQHIYARQGGFWEPSDPALGVYETVDGGQHWAQILQGNITDLSMHPFEAGIVVAVKQGAILLTRDGGDTWENITGNYPVVGGIEQLAICPAIERIYVADVFSGLWATEIDPTAVNQTPIDRATLSIYPNPFNPATTLSFSLSRGAEVSLFVTDVHGRAVRSLVAGEFRPAGKQTVTWDGRDDRGQGLPSGLYFAHLQAGGERVSRKLLLLK